MTNGRLIVKIKGDEVVVDIQKDIEERRGSHRYMSVHRTLLVYFTPGKEKEWHDWLASRPEVESITDN